MNPQKIGTCYFNKARKDLTVGDIFKLHCDWNSSLTLQPPFSLHINDNPYALVILDILEIQPGKGSFQVTSYQPGTYHSNIHIKTSKGTFQFSHLGWQVNSIIPPQEANTVQPYPPYGPLKKPTPLEFWLLGALCIVLLLTGIFYKWYQCSKRKKFLNNIQDRIKGQNPFYEFIRQVTLLNRQVGTLPIKQIISNLKKHWQQFLEHELWIPVKEKTLKQTTKYIQRYHFTLYKKHISTITKFWIELENSSLSSEKLTDRECEQLLTLSRQISITIHQHEKS